jgi:hypothetical protein
MYVVTGNYAHDDDDDDDDLFAESQHQVLCMSHSLY